MKVISIYATSTFQRVIEQLVNDVKFNEKSEYSNHN